jgi:hypothetical protein
MPESPSPSVPGNSAALLAARDGAILCDLAPAAVLAIEGADAASFLHGQLSSDVAGLDHDACQYTSYNSPSGRMLANFVLWRAGPDPADGFRALLPGDIAAAVRKRLAMFVLRSKVTVTDVSAGLARYGVGGPRAADAMRAALGAAPPPFGVVRSDGVTVLGVPGPRFVVLAGTGQAAAIVTTLGAAAGIAGFDVWQWLTIRAGVPVITAATQDKFIPQTANWDLLGGVNFRKGCYTGQEIVARSQYLGRLKERLFAFRAPATPIVAGDRLYSAVFAEQPCGTVVNAARAPEGGIDLLAVLQLAAAADGDVRLGAPDGPRLVLLPLPYEVPAAAEPRPRVGDRPVRA